MGLNIKNPANKIQIVKTAGSSEMTWKGEKKMEIYDKQFEVYLLDETERYFLMKAKEWQETMDCD